VRVSKLGRIITIARARGIAIPPEITIPAMPAPTAPATPVIRE